MPQPQDPFLASAGWSLNELVTRGPRFCEIPRVSVSDQNLEATIRQHEASGVPLVIEGIHKHETWPIAMFDIQWLRDNSNQHIQVRNVPNRQDLDVTFAEFLDHVKSVNHYASMGETSRWYAKDLECPREWKEWLDTTTLVPSLLRPHGPADIMQNLPERGRVETLMCYLGIGDTFTPCHKDLCASFGHNLMCYTEDGGSAFWFMTDSSSASSMAKYFQSLGQELDLESHAMSIEEFSAAPCDIHITEQKAGDLVLVPPRSCHQVVNHRGLTVKMSWSRMTIRSAQIALRHELPIYRRVCRAETYRTKSTIHYTLRRYAALLEDEAKLEEGSASHDVFRRQLSSDVQTLLELFQEIIQEEYHSDAEILYHIIRDFNPEVYDTDGYPAFSCDFCGADIFVSFYCCKDCTLSDKKPSSVGDGLHICPGCYAEGRSCRCGGLMDPVQCWSMQILFADYNRAVRALRGIGVDVFNEVGGQVWRDNATCVFEAGTAIQKWRAERSANKGAAQCYAKARPHSPLNAVILHCGKCHKGRCLVHLAESGVHSSEAIVFYQMSRDQSPFHNFHLARRKSFMSDKEAILAAEVSGDSFAKLIGQKLAITALSYPHCQPLNVSHIKVGWYDRLKSHGMPAAAFGPPCAMDMSFPRDGDDWGSPLTDIGPEDSVSNTLVGQETPPRDIDPPKSGVSVSAKIQSSAAGGVECMKRKRASIIFDGVVVPPERKRKMNSGHAEPSPSATHPSRSSTSVRGDEKIQLEGPQSTWSTASSEGSLAHAISKIETLTTTMAEQNRKIEALIRDNTGLRDEIRNLSQTLQLSKRDLQRVEYTIPKMTGELKGKFEKMLEKSESRLQGPIDRLLEELGRMRANPPAPVHTPSIATYPPNTPFPPEPVPGDNEWAPRDGFIPADLNKQHYQENCEQHVGPPNPPPPTQHYNKYGRGGFRPFRGRGRGFRGGYSGNRPYPQRPQYFPSLPDGYGIVRVTTVTSPPTPTATARDPSTTPVPVPVPASATAGSPAPRHADPYHSHAYPHSMPAPSTSSTHSRDPRPRAHPYPQHTQPDRKPLMSPSPAPSSSYGRRWHGSSHPQTYERAQTPLAPPLARPQYRDDERHRVPPPPRSEAGHHDHDHNHDHDRDHGGYRDERYANTSYTVYSPAPSDEQLRWTTTPSDSVGQLHSQSRSQSPGPGSGPSRGYTGHGPADDVRGGRQ